MAHIGGLTKPPRIKKELAQFRLNLITSDSVFLSRGVFATVERYHWSEDHTPFRTFRAFGGFTQPTQEVLL